MSWEEFLSAHAWKFLALVFLLLGSAFFSGTETALFNLTRGQLYRLGRSSHRFGRLVASLRRNPQRILNTILLGNMLVNVGFAGISAVMVLDFEQRGAPPYAVVLASLVPLLVLILCGEVTPKMFAFVFGEGWALTAAAPMSFFRKAFQPFLWILEKGFVVPLTRILTPRSPGRTDITGDELEALLHLTAKRGIITHDANEILQEIIELTHLRVSDIMVPRVDLVAYDVDGSPEGLSKLFRRTHLRKIPVYERDIDHILGVVQAKRFFLNPDTPLRELVADVLFVPEAANLERLLLQFRTAHRQMGIVVDEYGGTAGLVTLEDVLEEIVGDISDAYDADRELPVQHIAEQEYLLDGDLGIHEWHEAFKMDLSGRRISTIGGFVTSLLGRLPQVGDVVTYRNLRFTVRSMRRRRIGAVHLELLENPG